MASEDDKKKAQALIDEVARLYSEAKTEQEKETWAKDALSEMERAIAFNPDNGTAWLWAGLANGELGNYEDMIANFIKGIEINLQNAPLQSAQEYTEHELDGIRGIIECLDKATESYIEDVRLWICLGAAKNALEDYKGAIDACESVTRELDNQNIIAWILQGRAKYALGDHDGAIEGYTKAINYGGSHYAIVWNGLGKAKTAIGQHESAVESYTVATQREPKYVVAWVNLGFTRNELADYEGAIEACTTAIELDPQNATAWNSLGVAKYRLGEYDDAFKNFDEAFRLNPNNEIIQRNRQAADIAKDEEKIRKKEEVYHKRLEDKSKQFNANYESNLCLRWWLFGIGVALIFGYIYWLWYMDVFSDITKSENPFGLLPYVALLFTILSPLIWLIRINIREAERNLTMREDYDGRLTVELYLQRFFSNTERREFTQKYMTYWMYKNPSETLIRLANKSAEKPELPQVEQMSNIAKNSQISLNEI